MAILKEEFNNGQAEALVALINDVDEFQVTRVIEEDGHEATSLWLFEPARPLMENELAGKVFGLDEIKGDLIIMRFGHAAACLKVIQELTILYGNLVKEGL